MIPFFRFSFRRASHASRLSPSFGLIAVGVGYWVCFFTNFANSPPPPYLGFPASPMNPYGVGHVLTWWFSTPEWRLGLPTSSPSRMQGVAHEDAWGLPAVLALSRACWPKIFAGSCRRPCRFCVSFQSRVEALGQDEDALALVRGADFSRAE